MVLDVRFASIVSNITVYGGGIQMCAPGKSMAGKPTQIIEYYDGYDVNSIHT